MRCVGFSYKERPILTNLTMSFNKSQVVAIIGASGCGKTTILRILGGLLRADSGQVLFDGIDMSALRSREYSVVRRRMGMLFQFGALFTDMNVFDNVAFPIRENSKLPESIVRDLVLMKLNAVGLRGAQSLMPTEISGGMVRRVALARAIALDPEVIFYDEPFVGLDPVSLATVANLIRTLNSALAATSIIVSHDIAESFAIADYAYFIHQGMVLASGTPSELLNSSDSMVRQFIEGKREGPFRFHYPAIDAEVDFGIFDDYKNPPAI